MPLPFRKNPKITTNWINSKTGKQVEKKTKKAAKSAEQAPQSEQ